jgi:ribonuclease D
MSSRKPVLPPPVIIRSDDSFRRHYADWAGAALLAVDTESNSLYAYREKVCLIQLSTREADYIVDPLAAVDVQPLGDLFANPAIEKVFHAAEYDVMCLKRDYGFVFNNLFDTMIAARVCGVKQFGLGRLLFELAGVEADKSHQRDDWGRRPLPADSLLYAQMDTHYLPALRDHFTDLLTTLGRTHEAQELFEACAATPAAEHHFDPDGFWKIALPNHLNRRQTAMLRELYLAREEQARRQNVPTFKVLADKHLAAVVQYDPQHPPDLDHVPGLPPTLGRRYTRLILEALARGRTAPLPPQPIVHPPADPRVVEVFSALREWRRLRAEARGVESDVIIAREVLWAIAQQQPRTLDDLRAVPGMGAWRLNAYGEELIGVVARAAP